LPNGWNVVCEDESIFVYDSIIRTVWAIKGSKPRVLVTGSHKKTCIFGALSIDGYQMFRQYLTINSDNFLKFLRCAKRKFNKFVFFYDGAPWHKTEKIKKFFEENKDCIIPVLFPRCSPEFNPLEECWRQGKDDILGSRFPSSFDVFLKRVSKYYRTKRFNLDVVKYLCH
jgi:transposase